MFEKLAFFNKTMLFSVYLLILRLAVLRYIFRLLASSSLPSSKHKIILTYYQTMVNKKIKKSPRRHEENVATEHLWQKGTETRNGPITSRILWNRDFDTRTSAI